MSDENWYELKDYAGNLDKCIELLSQYLNKGQLGLILGAGVSKAFNFPNWKELVVKCIKEIGEDKVKVDLSGNFDLKSFSQKFKDACLSQLQYLQIVHNNLYERKSYNFDTARIEMLIALTSLMVGKVRGNVHDIITYNFDDLLEWYLRINGLSVNVVTKDHLLATQSDVDIFHLHGYLPLVDSKYVSNDIVFTKKEFEARERGKSYWKELADEFYKKHIFLTIGTSADTICSDLIPFLDVLTHDWYEVEGFTRNHPYGFAFLTDCSDDRFGEIVQAGIVPCILREHKDFPPAIFAIAQKAGHID